MLYASFDFKFMVVVVVIVVLDGWRFRPSFFCSGATLATHDAYSTAQYRQAHMRLRMGPYGSNVQASHLFHFGPPALHYNEEAGLAMLRSRAAIGEA